MHGKNMDACEMENQHMHLHASPQPFPHLDPLDIGMFPVKKKAKEKIDRRIGLYKDHHKIKKDQYNEVSCEVYTEEIQESAALRKKFLETKAKKTKKEKGDKSAKKNDVLSVSLINDENRSAAYHRINNVPSVNGGLASPSNAPVKTDHFDHDLPSIGAGSDAHSVHGNHELFSSRFPSLDEFPNFLTGSLDDLLPNDDQGLNTIDVDNMLDEISHELNSDYKQHVDSLDIFFPSQGLFGGREVKVESYLDEISSFVSLPSADATGTFSARSAGAASAAVPNAPHLTQQQQLHQRITPDHVRTVDAKRLAHDEAAMLAQHKLHQQQQQHQSMLMQQQQQQRQHAVMQQYLPSSQQQQQQSAQQQKSISPFGVGDIASSSSSSINSMRPHDPATNMCFSPSGQVPPDMPPLYGNLNTQFGPGRQPYDANQIMNRQQIMRMNQGSPGAAGANIPNGPGGGRSWQGDSVPLSYHQQKQMSLASGTDLPYGATMHSISGQMAGGPGKPVFHQGAPGYPPNQMGHRAQGLPGPYGYVNGNGIGVGSSMPRPQQMQYRGMLPNGQPVSMQHQQPQPGKMYPGGGGGGGAGAGNPYAGHIQQCQPPTAYQQNVQNAMDQQAAMRQMTGYRPPYTQQQPAQVQPQHQQQPTFMTSSNVNPALHQQQQQGQAQQPQQSFYMQQQQQQQQHNGFPNDQMNYQHQGQPDIYGATWSA